MTRKLTGIVAAVLLTAVGTAVLVFYVQSIESRVLAGEETVEVLVASETIPVGTGAGAVTGMVRTEHVPAKVRAEGALRSLDDVEGQRTSVELLAGEQLTAARFVDPQQVGEASVPDDLQQVTVQLSLDRAIGGRIAPGDTVAVLASFTDGATDDDGAEGETSHMILHKVLVSRVTGADGTAGGDADQPAGGGAVLVTLALDAPDVERVVFAAEHGSVWLSDDPANAPESGTGIQSKESIYR